MVANDTISKEATDLIKVATTFGGYDKITLMARCLTRSGKKVTIRTVEAVLSEMYDEANPEEAAARKQAVADFLASHK